MRLAMPQDAAYRSQRVAVRLEIRAQAGDEGLDLLRCPQVGQHAPFLGGEAEFGGKGASASAHLLQ